MIIMCTILPVCACVRTQHCDRMQEGLMEKGNVSGMGVEFTRWMDERARNNNNSNNSISSKLGSSNIIIECLKHVNGYGTIMCCLTIAASSKITFPNYRSISIHVNSIAWMIWLSYSCLICKFVFKATAFLFIISIHPNKVFLITFDYS